jgi:hypothetical protein
MSYSKRGRGIGNRRKQPRSGKLGPKVRIHTTVGDLIVAAFDTVGGEARGVARLVSSLSRATGARIVLV